MKDPLVNTVSIWPAPGTAQVRLSHSWVSLPAWRSFLILSLASSSHSVTDTRSAASSTAILPTFHISFGAFLLFYLSFLTKQYSFLSHNSNGHRLWKINKTHTKQEQWDGCSQPGNMVQEDIGFVSHQMCGLFHEEASLAGAGASRECGGYRKKGRQKCPRERPDGSWVTAIACCIVETIFFISKRACSGLRGAF